MTTFKQFIFKSKDFDMEEFKEQCAPILTALKKVPTSDDYYNLLLHGSRGGAKEFEIKKWKPRTKPLDTQQFIHDFSNEYFNRRFMQPIRDWMFCTSQKHTANTYGYGDVYAIFPIGTYNLYSSPQIRDLYDTIDFITDTDEFAELTDRTSREEYILQQLEFKFDDATWYNEKQLGKILASKSEIMLRCDTFYQINIKSDIFTQQVLPYFHAK